MIFYGDDGGWQNLQESVLSCFMGFSASQMSPDESSSGELRPTEISAFGDAASACKQWEI